MVFDERGNLEETPSSSAWLIHQSPALSIECVEGLGLTFVARQDIAAGELLVCERPSLMASSLRQLPRELRSKFKEGAEELASEDLMLSLDDLLIVHAFACSDEETRVRALSECCGAEVCEDTHEIVLGAKKAAQWCKANDPACANLDVADMERIVCIFALNSFGMLADGASNGATSLFVRGAKFTHRCLLPSAVFHGQDGTLCFRATRPISAGEIPTISYLGQKALCGTARRRRLLQESKGFTCACADCCEPDSYRLLPCPHCCGERLASTGLLSANSVERLATAIAAFDPFRNDYDDDDNDGDVRRAPASFIESSICTKVEYERWLLDQGGDAASPHRAKADARLPRTENNHRLPVLRRHLSDARTPDVQQQQQQQPEKEASSGIWKCDACGSSISDADVDVACTSPPAGDKSWMSAAVVGASGGAGGASPFLGESSRDGHWALRMPPGGLFRWESSVEESVHNLLSLVQEEPLTRASSGTADGAVADAGAARALASLRRLPALLGGVIAILGPAHGSVHQLLEMQLDHWLEIAMTAAQGAQEEMRREGEHMDASRRAQAEASLLDTIRDEASCFGFSSSRELLDAIWERTELLWRLRAIRGHEELWELVHEVVELLEAWGMKDAIFGIGEAAEADGKDEGWSAPGAQARTPTREAMGRLGRARRMVATMQRRAALEYGEGSDDAKDLQELLARLALSE